MKAMRSLPWVTIAVLALLLLAAVLAPGQADAQCAMCRKSLNDTEAGALISALRSGIAFLLVVPLATFGAIAYFAVRGQRRLERAGSDAAGASS